MISVTFLEPRARDGLKYLVEANGARIMVDALFQGM